MLAQIAQRHDDDEPRAGASPGRAALLKEEDIRAIEGTYPDGITAVQIVDAFTSRGIKFSEASFRKYVQQGLLPRSRRVDGYTIEEIQGQFLLYTDLVEGVAEHLTELWSRLGADVTRLDPAIRRELEKQLAEVRRDGDRLVEKLGELTRRFAAPRTDSLRLAGAAGGAEDLL